MTAIIEDMDSKYKNAPGGAWSRKVRPRMDARPSQPCPLTTALDVIGGKWHLIVLYALAQQPRRFNELQRLTPGVSHKVLTQTVRHLETHGLVVRNIGTDASPCVQYSLSERGQTVRPILAAMIDWGHARLASGVIADEER